MRLYHGKIEDGAWPKAFLDAAQGAQDAEQSLDSDSDGQQQQAAQHRCPGRSRSKPQLAESQEMDARIRDRIAKFPPTSTAQQQAASTTSVPPANTLTYSDEPLPGVARARSDFEPITDKAPRRSGRRRRPPVKLRVLASRSHAVPGIQSSTCSVNFVDDYCCSDTELASSSKYNRLTSKSSSSDNSSSDSFEKMDTYRCCDVRVVSAEPRVALRLQNNTNFVPRRCSKCRDVGIITAVHDAWPDDCAYEKGTWVLLQPIRKSVRAYRP